MFHAWEMFFPLSCAVVHFGIVPGVILPSLSYSTDTVFANPPEALLPGCRYLVETCVNRLTFLNVEPRPVFGVIAPLTQD